MLSMGEAFSEPVIRFRRKVADKLFWTVNNPDLETKAKANVPVETLFE